MRRCLINQKPITLVIQSCSWSIVSGKSFLYILHVSGWLAAKHLVIISGKGRDLKSVENLFERRPIHFGLFVGSIVDREMDRSVLSTSMHLLPIVLSCINIGIWNSAGSICFVLSTTAACHVYAYPCSVIHEDTSTSSCEVKDAKLLLLSTCADRGQ